MGFFNTFIIDARERSITSMLKNIKLMMMRRSLENKEKAKKLWQRIRKVLRKNIHETGMYIYVKFDNNNYG